MNVGELSAATGVTVRSVHHYESVGLLKPLRGDNGYRVFDDDDVRRVELIRRFQSVGFLLAEIRDLAPCWRDDRSPIQRHDDELRTLYQAKLAEISHQLEALATVRNELELRLAGLDVTYHSDKDS
jgi:DNA-binding transcriptional MerR regulator